MKLLPQLELFLTVSHLALALSSSNLANSLRSWMVIRSFQMSRPTRPNSRMAPATARSTTKMLGPSGHSERADEWAERDYDMNYTTLTKQARYLTVHFYYCTFLNAQILSCVWMALEKIRESPTGRTLCSPVSVAVQTHTH